MMYGTLSLGWSLIFRPLAIALLVAVVGVLPRASVQASESAAWRLGLIPASLNHDATLRLLAGHTQAIDLMLQASEDVRASKGPYRVEMAFDLPPGAELVHLGGGYNVLSFEHQVTSQGRMLATVLFDVPDSRLAGSFNGLWLSEWRNQTLFLKMPAHLASDASYLKITLKSGEHRVEQQWPIQLMELTSVEARRPARTTIGLWDYNQNRAGLAAVREGSNVRASEGMARKLAAAGINFTHKGSGVYHQAVRERGITVGGDVHQSAFYTSAYADIRLDGSRVEGDYPCAQMVADLPAGTTIPGVQTMLQIAREHDGMATYDYEPRSITGFSPASVAAFKQAHQVDDQVFEGFVAAFREQRGRFYLTEDPKHQAMYRQWVAFRTAQNVAYMKRLHDEVKERDPEVVIAMTPNNGYSADDIETLGYGNNAAAGAPYVDIIMPQIYVGYGGAAVKFTADLVQKWRASLNAQQVETKLWPLLLVRYAGASVANSPRRVRQQMIGTLAEGAEGLLLYYPGVMDALHWQQLARTTEEIATYEAFYQDGQRVDDQFSLENMPQGKVQINRYPGHLSEVVDPQWAFFAHEDQTQVLLTLMNLEDANDVLFTVKLPDGWQVARATGVEAYGPGQWLVGPTDIGFVILSR